MVWPTLILSVLVSFTAVWLNDLAVSWGRRGQERVVLESLEAIAYGQLEVKGFFEYRTLKVYVKDVDGRTLVQPTIVVKNKGADRADILTARSAQFAADVENGQLMLRMEDVDATGEFDFIQPGMAEQELPLNDLLGNREKSRSPSHYSLSEIGPARQVEEEIIERSRQDMSTEAAFAMLTGEFSELGEGEWQEYQKAIHNAEARLNRFYSEPWRRWSSGFSCLAFACVGIPVAVMLRKGEMLASFFACFLPILIVYYPMLMGTIIGAKKGTIPSPTVWLGNVVLILVGLYLMRRVVRH